MGLAIIIRLIYINQIYRNTRACARVCVGVLVCGYGGYGGVCVEGG